MKKIVFVLFCLIFSAQFSFAQGGAGELTTDALLDKPKDLKVIILPDNLQVVPNKFNIYPESAELLAVGLMNNLKSQKVIVPSVSTLRYGLEKDLRLKMVSRKLMENFKITYNVDYVALKKIADMFGVDKAILITSHIDVQNYFLRHTLWDFLNIPGATVIDPAHKLTTYVVLIDTTNETILWSETYEKMLKRFESRVVPMDFDTNLDQVNKIKFHYSFIAPAICYNVMTKIDPSFEATVNAVITNPEVKTEPIEPAPVPVDDNIKPVSHVKPVEGNKLPVVEQAQEKPIVKPVVAAPELKMPNPADPVFSGLKKPELRK